MLEHALTQLGHSAILAGSVADGMKAVVRQPFDLIISDYRMPDATGLDLLEQLRREGHEIPVIIMTGYSSIENAVLSMRHGAIDYLSKPLRQEALRIAVTNAIEVVRLRRENEGFRQELATLRGDRTIIGDAPALRRVLQSVMAVAPTPATVLLEGESGTGKELVARAIHEASPRAEQPFITVNCAAMPEGLVESALFGHERGAFTGASARTPGAFERAHKGTLLLDEISEMRLDLQAKLLRVIQEQEFERVGGHQSIRVDVRLIATTNRDLAGEVAAGRFRQDLYYRLHVVPIRTPPLRERKEDIPQLVDYLIERNAHRLGIRPVPASPAALELLRRHDWPGNIRELSNAVERALIMPHAGALEPGDFSQLDTIRLSTPGQQSETARDAGLAIEQTPVLPLNLHDLEELAIQRALETTRGHRGKAAELLGISERTLRNRLNSPTVN